MEGDTYRTVAVWAVFVLPFCVLVGFLSTHDRLTIEIVALYWFPAVALTSIGIIPPPWDLLVSEARSA
ncbi:hypothetical protein C489_10354 [Natrinema versiforme JCM 10478]|uniref:Uncharacterized protein n=1 Tax=Natrinema versiforme JCM 10478 TaxID=1227496 RepID=L9Y0C2_9EURY|nr:hypothetical protein C489_10354 [Natrinema versiforme JCM 10478]